MTIARLSVCSIILIGLISLSGCFSKTHVAPVVNAWKIPRNASTYLVKRGDTLYSVAWSFGLDYKDLARVNHLPAPYTIHPGQRLDMDVLQKPRASKSIHAHHVRAHHKKPIKKTHSTKSKYVKPAKYVKHAQSSRRSHWVPKSRHKTKRYHYPAVKLLWHWPVRGRVIQGFSKSITGNRGLNITGHLGEPIRAAASGEVVYCGDGVRGYGNLIIIKHSPNFLSAYAHNQRILVTLGQRIELGQVIGRMGRDVLGKVVLHFEIRDKGRPVDPMRYLPKVARKGR